MSKRNRSAKTNASNGKITNITQFFRHFGTEQQCEKYLFNKLYPDGFNCPVCGNKHCSKINTRREYQCTKCSHQFSLIKGTVMENSKLSLSKWFLAAFLITNDKRGISGMQLARELEVCDKTAYFMLQRLRSAMVYEGRMNVLSSEIELDDAYVGASKSGSKRGRGCDKVPFIAAVEKGRKGGCAMRATSDLTAKTFKEFARDFICKNSHIRTDGFVSLKSGLASWPGLDSKVFSTSDNDSSLRCVHHIISNFKAFIVGTYHGVSKRWMQSYMDEFSWRYKNRHNRSSFLLLIDDMCKWHCKRKNLIKLFAPQSASMVAA